jgi:hypothetical protein
MQQLIKGGKKEIAGQKSLQVQLDDTISGNKLGTWRRLKVPARKFFAATSFT